MGKFVYFTSAEKRQANEVDLPSFLLDRGEKLIMAGRDYRLVSDHSITVRGPMWYHALSDRLAGTQLCGLLRYVCPASAGAPAAESKAGYGLSLPRQ